MTRSELVSELAERADLTLQIARIIVDAIFDDMKDSLVRGERIEIRGFASFSVRSYDGRKGRNPKTGQIVDVRPKRLPFFKLGKALKQRINSLT